MGNTKKRGETKERGDTSAVDAPQVTPAQNGVGTPMVAAVAPAAEGAAQGGVTTEVNGAGTVVEVDGVGVLVEQAKDLKYKESELAESAVVQIGSRYQEIERLKQMLRDLVGDNVYNQIVAEHGWDVATESTPPAIPARAPKMRVRQPAAAGNGKSKGQGTTAAGGNKYTILEGVRTIAEKYTKPLGLNDFAEKLIRELGYQSKSDIPSFVKAVYTGGVTKLIKLGVLKAVGKKGSTKYVNKKYYTKSMDAA